MLLTNQLNSIWAVGGIGSTTRAGLNLLDGVNEVRKCCNSKYRKVSSPAVVREPGSIIIVTLSD